MPISVNGQSITDQQIKDFYAQGGNDNQWLQQNGVTDLNQIHQLANQARDIAGKKYSSQDYFKQYQSASPNGAFANDYNGWMNNTSPTQRAAIENGSYTGVANAGGQDYGFGGIYGPGSANYGTPGYGSGLGKNGMGDGWDAAAPSGGSTGGGNLGFGSGSSGSGSYSSMGTQSSGGQNPYLQQQGQDIIRQMTDNYNRNELPAMRSGAMAAGGFGGSRQGVVEANGLNDLNRGIGQNLTNLYGQDWTNGQNRNLQQQSINNSYDLGSRGLINQYDLGLRSSDLGFANLDANIANSNFSNQLNAANFGLNATNAMNGQTGSAIQAGTNVQRTPMDYHNYFTNAANNAGGLGGNTTGSQTSGSNPYASMAGGAMMGYDLYKQWNQPQQNLGMGSSDRSALYGNMGQP